MSVDDKYFQFPIAALRMKKPITEVTYEEMYQRLGEIFNYCIIETGTSIVESKPEEMVAGIINRSSADIDPYKATHQQRVLICGHQTFNFTIRYNWNVFSKHHKLIESLASDGGSQLCRVKHDFLWEAYTGRAWSWRDLSTLCAIYSGIGRYARAKLTYDRIGAMSLGFNGQRERDAYEFAHANIWQLTDKQTLRTVDNLRKRGLFVSASPNRRHVFYSHRMSLDGLIDNLAETSPKAKPSATSITERIKQKQAELAAKP